MDKNLYLKKCELEKQLYNIPAGEHAKQIIKDRYNMDINKLYDFFVMIIEDNNRLKIWYDIEFLDGNNKYKRLRFYKNV